MSDPLTPGEQADTDRADIEWEHLADRHAEQAEDDARAAWQARGER